MNLSFYNGKKVFITGHSGFKGTWLCRILLQAGAEITGYALESPTEPSLFEQTKTKEDIQNIFGDVRNSVLLVESMMKAKPDIVFHLAAQPIVRQSYKEPVETYEINVMGTINVLEGVRKSPSVRSFVNVTTDKVYKNKEWLWGYREDEELCGFDPYSNSKSCSELVTYSYKNSFFNNENSPAISTARSGNVIGGGDYAIDRIIPDCIRAVLKGERIIIRNPYSTRPYQHVLECLSGYLLLAQKQFENKNFAGNYNFGPDGSSCVTTGELVELFCSSWGKNAKWRIQGDGGPHEANFLKLDCSKSKSVLGWKPHWDIRQAIGSITEWEKALLAKNDAASITDIQIKNYFGV
ncbi:MAG: CDP-glucose 4,6-dehydratase [Fibrobacteraceae bacterium]|nr:CDP-glucose 4,6-dehydratase [Fibrobacteraceae bacterium]